MTYIFAAYETGNWSPWDYQQRLSQDKLFEIVRNAVTAAAALGVGITLFFSYRRQQTAESTQLIAARAQTIAANALQLSTQQHTLELDRRTDQLVKDLRERFSKAAEHLGSEHLSLTIAAVHSLESLADEWHALGNDQERQNCVSLLCAFVRYRPSQKPRAVHDLIVETLLNRLKENLPQHSYWPLEIDLSYRAPLGTHGLYIDGARVQLKGLRPTVDYDARYTNVKLVSGVVDFSDFNHDEGSLHVEDSLFEGGEAMFSLDPDNERGGQGYIYFKRCQFRGSRVLVSYGSSNLNMVFEDCSFDAGAVLFATYAAPKSIRLVRCKVNTNAFAVTKSYEGFAYANLEIDRETSFRSGVTKLGSRSSTIRPRWAWEKHEDYLQKSGVPPLPSRRPLSGTRD